MAEYSGGVMVASTSQACTSCSMILLTRASILKALPQLVAGDAGHRRRQLVQQQLHPQLAGLVLHDEEHLVVFGRERVLRFEQLVQVQVVAIAHVAAEIELGAFFGDDALAVAGWWGVLGHGSSRRIARTGLAQASVSFRGRAMSS